MVISKYFLEKKWSRPSSSAYGQSNMWHQSIPGRSLRKRLQYDFIQRKLKREKEAQIRTCIRQITQDCKEMLTKKMEEIELYNSTNNQTQFQNKNRRHKCFKCRQRGHVIKNCPMKKQNEGIEKNGDRSETEKAKNEVLMASKPSKQNEGIEKNGDRSETEKAKNEVLMASKPSTARVTTRNVEEVNGVNCLTSHQSDFAEIRTPNVEAAKGKEKMEHFGIELEDTSYESDNLSPIHPSIKERQTMSKDNQ
nr:ARID DNA-binding domain-containing protein [Tanacetum cinerariifolium]